MDRKAIENFGRMVWGALPATGEWATSAVAEMVRVPGEDAQAPYRRLKTLAEYGFPCATRGPARTVKRYGKPMEQRPWVWSKVGRTDVSLNEWAAKLAEAKPKGGAYAALEVRVAALEAAVFKKDAGK